MSILIASIVRKNGTNTLECAKIQYICGSGHADDLGTDRLGHGTEEIHDTGDCSFS